MGELLKGPTLIDLADASVAREDLRVVGGSIAARGAHLAPVAGDRVTDLSGKVVMGGLVAAHTHLYTSLLRGLPPPSPPPRTPLERVERETWKLDRAHDLETVTLAAQVGAAEALRCGVTTLIDHHSSPSCIAGSLAAVRCGVDRVGLRAVLCVEVSDRNGTPLRDAALRETEEYLASGSAGRFRSIIGAHASYTLEPETLDALVGLACTHELGLHLHVAEVPEDENETQRRFGKSVIARLAEAGALGPRSILAHCVNLGWEDLSEAQQRGAWLVHCPRADMARAAGYAPAGKFGARKALGSDGISGDMLAEGQAAYLRGAQAGSPLDLARWHGCGQSLASELFGVSIGPLRAGSAADLVVLDECVATPLALDTLTGHLAMGITSAHVDAVMVDGAWRLWAKELLSFDEGRLRAEAQQAARLLWNRMREL